MNSAKELPLVELTSRKNSIKGSVASPIYNLKGTYQVISDKYKHLSLLNGAIAWETGYIEKLLTVDVKRDENNPTKIIEGSAAANLCNYLFTCYPSRAKDIPSVIGIRKLFEGDDQTIDDESAKFIASQVAEALYAINLRAGTLVVSDRNKMLMECATHIERLSDCRLNNGKEIIIQKNLSAETEELQQKIQNKEIYQKIQIRRIAGNISSVSEKSMPHTAEMILLAFIYRALGHHKGYIKYFYEALNKKLEYKFLLHPRARSVFTHYPHLVYENVVSLMSWKGLVSMSRLPKDWEYERYDTVTPKEAKQKIERLLAQDATYDFQELLTKKGKDCSLFAEDLVFYASQLSYIPKPLGAAWATYKLRDETHKNENGGVGVNANFSFFDTTGNAVRNFIRLLSYDYERQVFSWKKLKQICPHVRQELIDYLQEYPGPEYDDTPEAYHDWAELMADKNYILYQHAFELKKKEQDTQEYYSWGYPDKVKKCVTKIQNSDRKKFVASQLSSYGFPSCTVYAQDDAPYENHNVEMVPFVINSMLMIHYLLEDPTENQTYKMFFDPIDTFFQQGIDTRFGCFWSLKCNDSKKLSPYDRLNGFFSRAARRSWRFWSTRRVTFYYFSFVNTPHYGTFVLGADRSTDSEKAVYDISTYSQKPEIDPVDIDYDKTPALSLLITRLAGIDPEEQGAFVHLPERLRASNGFLLKAPAV